MPTVEADGVDGSHVKEHWLVISNSLTHDHNFVNHCINNILDPELQKLGCTVQTMHQRTDGCAAQYKSANCFGDVSCSERNLKFKVIHSYSGSGHGKGEVDSAAGYLKTAARKATDLYNFTCENLGSQPVCKDSLNSRQYFYVDQDDIQSSSSEVKFRTIKGTQKLHSVASVGIEGQLDTRLLTCYCLNCINGDYNMCENTAFVEPFKRVHFSNMNNRDEEPEESIDEETDGPEVPTFLDPTENIMYEMIFKDSVVAIRPNAESLSDYFLFHVTSDGMECLEQNLMSAGHLYSAGTYVLHGFYYEIKKSNRKGCLYKQCVDANTTIPAVCVLYVGIDLLKDGEKFILQSEDHEDIMCAIANI